MNSVYLHKDDIQSIVQFMAAFPGCDIVEVTSDTSSGIGAITEVHAHHVDVNGMKVKVSKTLVDESSW